jgi:DNA-binding NtrC family response regulator
MAHILCVDDDAQIRHILLRMLERLGHSVEVASSVRDALAVLAAKPIDLIFTDWSMPHLTGIDLLELLREEGYETPVVMLTAFGSIDHAVTAIKAGAVNYLLKPFELEQIEITVAQALEVARLRSQNAALVRESASRRSEQRIVGESMEIRKLLTSIAAAAGSRATVLLQGESGTGKELTARAIHEQSERANGPFVQLNCAALPEHLIESALFGHEKGAFTGAYKRTLGAFERAHGGTLLLDEISEMRVDLQPKLLRVLQEREFERVGGAHPVRVDVRIIATTNRDLMSHVAAGNLRQDLYYRLSVFPIDLPPLRQRAEDIPLLAYRFATVAAAEANKPFEGFAPEALARLVSHSWPGNVRELQHAVERAVILSQRPILEASLFALQAAAPVAALFGGSRGPGVPELHTLTFTSLDLRDVEEQVIAHALQLSDGNRTRAAALLGLDVRTLRRKLNASVDDLEDTMP